MERLLGCDPAKRALLLRERHLDLLDMAEVFADAARLDVADARHDDGELRRVTVGRALGGIDTVVDTLRGSTTWLITALSFCRALAEPASTSARALRPANRKERARYGERA